MKLTFKEITELTIREISEKLEREKQRDSQKGLPITAYEEFVGSMPITLIRKLHSYQIDVGLIVRQKDNTLDVNETASDLPLTIMTYIALNERLGIELENQFPEYANANPDNIDW